MLLTIQNKYWYYHFTRDQRILVLQCFCYLEMVIPNLHFLLNMTSFLFYFDVPFVVSFPPNYQIQLGEESYQPHWRNWFVIWTNYSMLRNLHGFITKSNVENDSSLSTILGFFLISGDYKTGNKLVHYFWWRFSFAFRSTSISMCNTLVINIQTIINFTNWLIR